MASGFASAFAPVFWPPLAPPGPTFTSCRLPVVPSMMVTVCPLFSPSASAAGAAASGLLACGAASPALAAGAARVSALTIATGSPPYGSSTNRIQPASTATQSASTPAIERETSHIGTTKRVFFFCLRCPSGFERSSVDSALADMGWLRLLCIKPNRRALTDRLP